MKITDSMINSIWDYINKGKTIETWASDNNFSLSEDEIKDIRKQLLTHSNNKRNLNRLKNIDKPITIQTTTIEPSVENSDDKMPSTLQKAKNLAEFAKDATKGVLKGEGLKSEKTLTEKRMMICEACPNLVNDHCKLCGCYMPRKTKFQASKCPDKPSRWIK